MPSIATGLSQRYPEVRFEVRPVGFRWMVRCRGARESLDRLARECQRTFSALWVDREPEPFVVFAYLPGARELSFLRDAGSRGGLLLPPLLVRDGNTRFRLLCADPARSGTFDPTRIGARLVARRRLSRVLLRDAIELFAPTSPSLTPQQSRVLIESVRSGYYEVPRRTTVEKIAGRLSLARSTAEEHLRAAESIIVSRALPLVELSSYEPLESTEPVSHAVAFSAELELYVDLALRGEWVETVRLLRSAAPTEVGSIHPHLRRILRHLTTGREDLHDIPVRLNLSPFARRVLEEVRRIPAGETRSYAEVARRVGRPTAYRAVGNVVAHNPAPLVIPCHRVVPRHGGVGNYSAEGGTRTKRRLLELEGAEKSAGRRPRRRARRPPVPDATIRSGAKKGTRAGSARQEAG